MSPLLSFSISIDKNQKNLHDTARFARTRISLPFDTCARDRRIDKSFHRTSAKTPCRKPLFFFIALFCNVFFTCFVFLSIIYQTYYIKKTDPLVSSVRFFHTIKSDARPSRKVWLTSGRGLRRDPVVFSPVPLPTEQLRIPTGRSGCRHISTC